MNYLELFESFTQKIVNNVKNITQENKREQIVAINFKDPEVERICHEHGVYTIGDAAQVRSIEDWFKENSRITSFDEFKYFLGLTSIGKYAFHRCIYLQYINIPNNVTIIRDCAFVYCRTLQSVTIPDSVTSIGESVFEDCTSLQSVTIPNSVTSIGRHAFGWCSSLQSITIPDSVTYIEDHVFRSCTSLKSIVISKNSSVYDKIKEEYYDIQLVEPTVSESFTTGVINKAKSIKSNNNDKRDQVLFQIDFKDPEVERICHEHGVYTRGDAAKVSTINHRENSSWFKDNENINEFNEFQYFTGLKIIGQSSFYGCKNLKYITIPENVEIIEDYAFCECESLETINIPDTVIKFGEDVITWCRSLRTIIISKNHPIKRKLISLKKKNNYHFNFITIDDIKNMIEGLKLAIGKNE